MAIIQCPECGQDVSDKAKQCVHCGCKFTVCKECGNVVVGEAQTCSACGYLPEVADVKEPEKTKEVSTTTQDIYKDPSGPFKSFSMKRKQVVRAPFGPFVSFPCNNRFLRLLFVVCWLAAVMIFSIWFSGQDNEKIVFGYKRMLRSVRAFLIICGILNLLMCVVPIFLEKKHLNAISVWLNAKKIDSVTLVREVLSDNISASNPMNQMDFYYCLHYIVLNADINKNYKRNKANTLRYLISFFCTFLTLFFLLFCALRNLEAVSGRKFWYGTDYEFEFSHLVDLWALAVAGGIVIVWSIMGETQPRIFLQKNEVWIKTNLPDEYSKYLSLKASIKTRNKSNF